MRKEGCERDVEARPSLNEGRTLLKQIPRCHCRFSNGFGFGERLFMASDLGVDSRNKNNVQFAPLKTIMAHHQQI